MNSQSLETEGEVESADDRDADSATAIALEMPPRWEGDGAVPQTEDAFTRQILHALIALRNGDFSRRLPVEWVGVHGKIADTFNEILAFNDRRAHEIARVCRMVGKEGKLEQRMAV